MYSIYMHKYVYTFAIKIPYMHVYIYICRVQTHTYPLYIYKCKDKYMYINSCMWISFLKPESYLIDLIKGSPSTVRNK